LICFYQFGEYYEYVILKVKEIEAKSDKVRLVIKDILDSADKKPDVKGSLTYGYPEECDNFHDAWEVLKKYSLDFDSSGRYTSYLTLDEYDSRCKITSQLPCIISSIIGELSRSNVSLEYDNFTTRSSPVFLPYFGIRQFYDTKFSRISPVFWNTTFLRLGYP